MTQSRDTNEELDCFVASLLAMTSVLLRCTQTVSCGIFEFGTCTKWRALLLPPR